MAVLGLGVGGVSATCPPSSSPSSETSSAMSVNQVIRAIGFSLGSAIAGLILSATTERTRLPHPLGSRSESPVVHPDW